MKIFAVFDLESDGVVAEECGSVEEAFERLDKETFYRGWVAVEIPRPTKRALDGGRAAEKLDG